ncbi:MAG: GUN4 domain-containing protein [Spirirestis rafaelensis WJT71-NPBG6]|nr:GUN4 domain-containing protein [Spirirestis rafaelensis WJT71-NPBG6]
MRARAHKKSGRIFFLLHNVTINEIKTEYPEVYKDIEEILVQFSISDEHGLDYVLDEVKKITQDIIIGQRQEFATLRDLLVAKTWSYADDETYRLIYKENFGLLNFPYEDLEIINRLWFIYSDGYYGFSIQKEIYIDESKSKNYSNPYKNFANRVKWYLNPYKNFANRVKWKREKGKWKSQYAPLPTPTYKGHFPAQVYFVNLGKEESQHKFQESSNYRKVVILQWLIGVCVVLNQIWLWGWVYFVLLVILIPLLGLGWFIVWFINLFIDAYFEFNVWDWLKDGFRSYQLHKFFSSYDHNYTTIEL